VDSAPILSLHSLRSRNFTTQETTAITRLYQEIVSLPFLQSLLSASAILPPEKNGVGVVVVQPDSSTSLVVTTPYGMLLLSFEDELDVYSAELLMTFIKARTERVLEMDDVITEDEARHRRLKELEDTEKLLYTLREIAETSEDAESVRIAFIALTTTGIGQAYIRENPIKL
jgi:hypothetical protein